MAGGAFDRNPDLNVAFIEVDAGWVPFIKQQLDNRVIRKAAGSDMRKQELPSAVIERHFYFSYITDHFAIANRHQVGLERILWSSDFPHSGSDWPNSAQMSHAVFANIPPAERDLILSGNAQRLYKFSGQ
jgi:predicted TIM-barrel fold metal-dependent hydrolase